MSAGAPDEIAAFIDALPSYRLNTPHCAPRHYSQSRWPLLKAYNGFSGVERRRGGQLVGWLQSAGCMEVPRTCDICCSRDRVAFHSESYYHIGRAPGLCSRCHRAIHLRHIHWDAWQRIVDASALTGREWFALIPRQGFAVANYLRQHFGWQVVDIEASILTPLPDVIVTSLPADMLSHPML